MASIPGTPLPVGPASPSPAPSAPIAPRKTGFVIAFKSLGHFFATVIQKVVAVVPKIEAGIQAVEGTAPIVEAVTKEIPVYGPLAVPIEKAGFAVLGELAAVLVAGGAAAEAKLADAGLDINVIATVKAVLADIPQVVALAKTL